VKKLNLFAPQNYIKISTSQTKSAFFLTKSHFLFQQPQGVEQAVKKQIVKISITRYLK
jgi:hypothetical protein